MAELPIMPLKTDALLADTTHMTAEEFGAYCRILFVMWRHGGRLKDDDGELAIIAGVPLPRWRKIAEKVRRPLTAAGGELSQKRMTDTWIDVQEIRKKRVFAVEERWRRKRATDVIQVHEQNDDTCNANQNQIYNLSSSEPRAMASKGLEAVCREKKWEGPKKNQTTQQLNPRHGQVLGPEYGEKAAGRVFLLAETPEWDAWCSYVRGLGKPAPPRYFFEGWAFASLWPPGYEPSEAAAE